MVLVPECNPFGEIVEKAEMHKNKWEIRCGFGCEKLESVAIR